MTTFWSSVNLQPKRKFRWYVDFPNLSEIKYAAKTINKPSFKVGNTAHQFINHTFHFPNRLVWEPVTVTLVDGTLPGQLGAEDSLTGRLYGLMLGSGYSVPSDIESCKDGLTKQAFSKNLGQVHIIQLGDDGKPTAKDPVLEDWTLHNCLIEDIKFGDLSYEDDGLVEITLTLVYDYATLVGVN